MMYMLLEHWLARTALAGSVVLAAACLAVCMVRQPARRQAVGKWGILAALLVSLLALLPPWWNIGWRWPGQAAAAAARTPSLAAGSENRLVRGSVTDVHVDGLGRQATTRRAAATPVTAKLPEPASESAAAAIPAVMETMPVARVSTFREWILGSVLALYSAGLLYFVTRWLAGHWVLHRILATAKPAPAEAQQLLREMTGACGWCRLLVSHRVHVPLSSGLFRPTIIIPEELCTLDASDRLRWILAHELTHIERADAWSGLILSLAQGLYYYSPCFWYLRRQIRLCQEYIADAAALGQAARADEYAEFLLDFAGAPGLPVLALGGSSRGSSDLFRRVTMILQRSIGLESRCPRWVSGAAALGLGFLAVISTGLGARADDAAPGQNVMVLVRADQPIPAGDLKAQPEKPAKVEGEIDYLLQRLPGKVDPAKLAELRAAQMKLEEASRDLNRVLKDLGDPGQDRAVQQPYRIFQVPLVFSTDNAGSAGKPKKVIVTALTPGSADRFMGIDVQEPDAILRDQLNLPENQGAWVVIRVNPSSPAAKAAMKVNDIILKINRKPVPMDYASLRTMTNALPTDKPFQLLVLRKGEKAILGMKLPAEREGGAASSKDDNDEQRQIEGTINFGAPRKKGPTLAEPLKAKGGSHVSGTVMTTVTRSGNHFTARHQEGTLVVTVSGGGADNKVSEIRIQDGTSEDTYSSESEVPERYRDKVKHLLGLVRKAKIQIEIESP